MFIFQKYITETIIISIQDITVITVITVITLKENGIQYYLRTGE